MRFSVIIPLYNKAPYVVKAIGSVLAQTFTDYELVIMDDGSKDDSFEIAKKAINGQGHCRLFRQQNAGVSMARNNAVALSQGEYLCFLDADDWWEPMFLEEMSKLIDAFPEAGIYGTNYTIVNEAKHKTRVASVGVEPGFEKGYINYCQVYAKTMYMPLTSISVAIPRVVFDEMGGFPQGIKLGEDFLLWIRVALKHKVAFLNKPLAYYNQDVDVANRGVGHLYKPEEHMLWNVAFLEEEEKTNLEYKQLIDNLRTYGLKPYYLSEKYHEAAKKELDKVDWNRQPKRIKSKYKKPLLMLRIENSVRGLGSRLKQRLMDLTTK
ncbi:MAG: glycosyltransferase family 2 protein [Bacteroidales bacterium]|nr:glycosyltransferase family 2 protein [Bacteroidales bacterium]MBR6227005.1 glycosyltransferase family 2 protein [Bacteroidales bacterium]